MSPGPNFSRLLILCTLLTVNVGRGSDQRADESSDGSGDVTQESAERDVIERFLMILKRQPKLGTALDRVYSYHLVRGTLDEFAASLRDDASSEADRASNAMLLGLLEMKRGNPAAAAEALRTAEFLRVDDPQVSWLLGRQLIQTGQADAAVEAFERAILRNPEKRDLLQIFQDLAKACRRSRHPEQADAVWSRMEAAFPNDVRVKEQIAVTMQEDGDLDGSLLRYQALVSLQQDPDQVAQSAITAAKIKWQLGRSDEAIRDLETQLDALNPDSWLHREVRDAIERIILKDDEPTVLAAYYEAWLNIHPEDLDAMSRLARTLEKNGQPEDARRWYRRAIERAPSSVALRKALIDMLVQEKQFAEAADQYEQLHRLNPQTSDPLIEWGRLQLLRSELSKAERLQLAENAWNLLLKNRPADSVTTVQVAELLRQAGSHEAALALYRQAIEQSPNESQYREYLGEFLHSLKRTDDAVAVWMQIAEGDRRTAPNLIRLAEVLNRYEQKSQALRAMSAACELESDFNAHLQFAIMLREYDSDGAHPRIAESLAQIDAAEQLAESPDDRRLVLEERLESLKAGGMLVQKTEELAAELKKSNASTVDQWLMLAKYAQACDQTSLAIDAVQRALMLDSDSVPALQAAADLFETAGLFPAAADVLRRLADCEDRMRTASLKRLASLERQRGRYDEAREITRELMAAAPGDPEPVQLYASLCFDLGQSQEGLNALRRAAIADATDVPALMSLATALADQRQTTEAIAVYWQAFEKVADEATRMTITVSLAELYLRNHQFDQLVQNLKGRMTDRTQQRSVGICLAGAFRVAGDLQSARETLERLLIADARDADLFSQLTRLAEDDGHLHEAADYQRRLNATSPSAAGRERLADLLFRLGEVSEAEAMWIRMGEASASSPDVIRAVDRLMIGENNAAAESLCKRLLERDPDHWEALLRLGVLRWRTGDQVTAMQTFDRLMELPLPDTPPALAGQTSSLSAAVSDTDSNVATQTRSRFQCSQCTTRIHFAEFALELLDAKRSVMPVSTQPELTALAGVVQQDASPLPQNLRDARGICIAAKWLMAAEPARQMELINAWASKLQTSGGVTSKTAMCDLAMFYELAQLTPGVGLDQDQVLTLANQVSAADDVHSHAMHLRLLRLALTLKPADEIASDPATTLLSREQAMAAVVSFESLLSDCPDVLTLRPADTEAASELGAPESDAQFLVQICNAARHGEAIEDLIERLKRPQVSRGQLLAAIWLSLARENLSSNEVLQMLGRVEQIDRQETVSEDVASKRFREILSVLTTIAVHKADEESAAIDVPQLCDWWLQHRSSYMTMNSARLWKLVNEDATAFAQHVTDDVDLKTDWLNPREELTSDVTVPGVDHLLTSEEFRMIESLSSQSDGNASSAAFRNWIWNHQADSAPTLPVLRAVLAFKERNLGDMIQHLSHAAELAPDDMRLRLTLIELCDVDGDLTQAREFLNQLPESSPLLFRFRELKLLQIAIREQDRDRAKAAAERLAGLQLDPETLQFLLTKCRALQFTELTAQLSPQTATPDASPRTGASLEKMNNYVTQGDLSAAAQVARQLIRRSGNTGTPWRRTSRLSPEEIRIRAYDVLKQSGELERMIERQQSQLEKSPHSKVLAQTLLEYLQAADRKKDVEKLRQSMIEQISGDSAESRWQRVQQQIAAGRRTDACSTLLQIFETHPEFILSHFDASVELLRSEQRLPQLIAMITQSPKTRAPSSPLSADQRTALMRVLTNDERLYESAAAWLTSLCEHSPVDALDAIRLIENRESWKHEKMFAILTRVYVPSPRGSVLKDGRESPQTLTFGPDLCWADDYERHVSATTSPERIGLDRLRLALSVSDRRRDFLQSVQQAETQYPNWNRNLALRLMIVLQEPDSQEPDSQEPDSADSVLTLLDQMLASDRQPLPEFIAFELANSLIVTHPEMKPDAMRLLNASLSNVATSRFHLASPALQKFVELGRETNSQASARQDILSCHSNLTKSTVTDNGDRIRIVGTHLAAARALVILDDPEQALRVLEGVTEDESLFRDFLRSPGYAFQDSRHLSSLDADEISKAARSKIATRKATLQ